MKDIDAETWNDGNDAICINSPKPAITAKSVLLSAFRGLNAVEHASDEKRESELPYSARSLFHDEQ